jgi:SAM-dependent methyltransferase
MLRYVSELLVRCSHCTMVFSRTMPSASELTAYYGAYPPTAPVGDLTRRRYEELLDGFEAVRRSGRLLDVGCGDGQFLQAARARGWVVAGSEYGAAPRERAAALGLDVRPAPFVPRPEELAGFDVVTAFEVLEHVGHPREEVRQIRALLRPGGVCYLTMPNFGSLTRRLVGTRWRAIEYPEHLNHFTAKSLGRLMADSGMSSVKIRTTGFSPAAVRDAVHAARGGIDGGMPAPAAEDPIRLRMETSAKVDRVVSATNVVLTAVRAGDTLKALYRR